MPPLVQVLTRLAGQSGCSDPRRCTEVLEEAARQQVSPVVALLNASLVDESQFLMNLGSELGLPWWREPIEDIPAPLRELVPARVALRHHLLPARNDGNGLVLLTYDPLNLTAQQVIAQSVPGRVNWAMAPRRDILAALRQGYGVGAETFEQILDGWDGGDGGATLKQETTVVDRNDSEDPTVIKFANQIIREALEEGATDIHFEPVDDDLQVRFRLDGVLHEVPVPARMKLLQASVISRLKIMAHLDIAERRRPQDGRINLEFEGGRIDVRVVTVPSVSGESVSLRLLGQEKFDFARLGLDAASEAKIRELLAMPNGIVLLTGPTGCGKSTTLYTFLSSLNTKQRRIVTIEDPVEQKLPGVIQIPVNAEIDLTFAASLRTILRGDPNVIMVGEMRDFETAEIAIRAALTGHLVFSTLHTNDAVGGITRLIDLGVERFLVGSAVRAFMAQRLVRVLCSECAEPVAHTEEYLRQIGFPREHAGAIRRAKGCERCRQTGYRGRTAIFEICMVTPRLQELISREGTANALRPAALLDGMVPLREYGWRKVVAGITTIEEVLRVTTEDVRVMEGREAGAR